VGLRAGVDGTENLTPTRIQSLDHPACSKSLHQLHSVPFSVLPNIPLQSSSHAIYKNDGSDNVTTFTNDKHWIGSGQGINGSRVIRK
jgi:hypothetical protein